MTQTLWSQLPNAKHIDRVLGSMTTNPEKWNAARDAIKDKVVGSVWDTAWDMAWEAARDMELGKAWNAAKEIARQLQVYDGAWPALSSAILALIAYDDCAYMLDSDVNELRIIAAFGDPRAILLLPACIVFNEMKIA